jgi:hypothetical protein
VRIHNLDRRKFLPADPLSNFRNRPKNYFGHSQAFENMCPSATGQAGAGDVDKRSLPVTSVGAKGGT